MNHIERCFNRSALSYNSHSQPQQRIAERLISSVYQYAQNYPLVADLGCGTGIVTQQLINRIRYNKLYAFDISEKCINLTKKRLPHASINIYHDDLHHLNHYQQSFNLIFSNMTLHWCPNIFNLMTIIKSALATEGIIAFSMPLAGTFKELKTSCRNHFYDLDNIAKYCRSSGINLLDIHEQSFIYNFNHWLEAIKSIKAAGANHLFHKKNQGLCRPIQLKPERFFNDAYCNKTSLTYHIGFFLGRNECL